MGFRESRWMIIALVTSAVCGVAAHAAAATPAQVQAFRSRAAIYVTFDVTLNESRDFTSSSSAISDGAFTHHRTMKGVIPLTQVIEGPPPSSQPLSIEELTEEGRFIGWMASPDIPEGKEDEIMAIKDLAKNPMFLPFEFSVDDVDRARYRDSPGEGWGTDTTVTKGHGLVFTAVSGMLLCDLKKMTCDLNNVMVSFNDGADQLSSHKTSDVPGFVPRTDSGSPILRLPPIPESVMKKLMPFHITLPEPIVMEISTSPQADAKGGSPAGSSSPLTVKVTFSTAPPPKSGAAR